MTDATEEDAWLLYAAKERWRYGRRLHDAVAGLRANGFLEVTRPGQRRLTENGRCATREHQRVVLFDLLDTVLLNDIGLLMFWPSEEELERDAFAVYVRHCLETAARAAGWDNGRYWDSRGPA